jgi:hypothetical protein
LFIYKIKLFSCVGGSGGGGNGCSGNRGGGSGGGGGSSSSTKAISEVLCMVAAPCSASCD